MVVVDMHMIDRSEILEECVYEAVCVCMPHIEGDPDTGYTFGEAEDLFRVAAEEGIYVYHILDAGKDAMILCSSRLSEPTYI